MNWVKLFKEISVYNWTILLILGLGSFFLAESDFTLGIILGGLIIIANFNVLQHTIRCSFDMDGVMKPKKKSIIAKYYLRLAIMGALIYALITNALVNPVGLAIGLSTVIISIVAVGIHMVLKQSTWETI